MGRKLETMVSMSHLCLEDLPVDNVGIINQIVRTRNQLNMVAGAAV